MKSTFEPGPAHLASRAWTLRLTKDAHADHMTAYYAGWFLDAATAGPRTIREGREEQQFPAETIALVNRRFDEKEAIGDDAYSQTIVEAVFAYEHFSRFETANRVWPPLVPATYWCTYFGHDRGEAVLPEHARECDNSAVLTYRRDREAPEPCLGEVNWHYQAIPTGGTMPKGCSDGGVIVITV